MAYVRPSWTGCRHIFPGRSERSGSVGTFLLCWDERIPEDGAVGVAGLLAEEDELGLLSLDRLRERLARRDEIRARERVVDDVHGTVGAERERLSQRVGRPRRAHEDGDDLAFPTRVLQAQRNPTLT